MLAVVPPAMMGLWMQLPLQLFNFVLHTGKSPIVSDACTDRQIFNGNLSPFKSTVGFPSGLNCGLLHGTNRDCIDPYVLKNKPKSIMMVPFTRRNEIISVLYLENNLAKVLLRILPHILRTSP
jgi:hypothetical protein